MTRRQVLQGGGWAAKELTENGLETLLLERGGPVEHGRRALVSLPTARPCRIITWVTGHKLVPQGAAARPEEPAGGRQS